jgi:competence protein ComEC
MKVAVLKRMPMVRMLLPFLLGLCGEFSLPFWLFGGLVVLGLSLACFPLGVKGMVWFPVSRGLGISLLFVLMGGYAKHYPDIRKNPAWYGNHLQSDSTWLLVDCSDFAQKKARSFKVQAHVQAMESNGVWQVAKGKILIYFAENPAVQPGHQLLLQARVQSIRKSNYLGAFDYESYAARQQIFHQIYLPVRSYIIVGTNGSDFLQRGLSWARYYCLEWLRKYIPDPESVGIAQALLIGYRAELEDAIVEAYTNTGVVHIIAISGLHLGLLYMSLLKCMDLLPQRKWLNRLKGLLLLTFLWLFSLLTGASASVLRSAVMFTIIGIGDRMLNRPSHTLNNLAAAAFLLLCYDPNLRFDVGFLLSFAAVCGILLLYEPIYNRLQFKNRLIDAIWQLTAVSLAAQMFTWPICVFYFHQFPNYFLIANLLAVPASTFLLYGEIALVALVWWDGAAVWIGIAVSRGIVWLNAAMSWINSWPASVSDYLYMDGKECFWALAICCMATWGLRYRNRWTMTALLSACVVWSVYKQFTIHGIKSQQILIIAPFPKSNHLCYVEGRQITIFSDSLLAPSVLRPTMHYFKLKSVQYRPIPHDGLYVVGSFSILQWKGPLPSHLAKPKQPLAVNLLWIQQESIQSIDQILPHFSFETLLWDGSNRRFRIQQWKNQCKELTLPCFSVPDEGTFVKIL